MTKTKKASIWVTAIVAILGLFGITSPVGQTIVQAITIVGEALEQADEAK